MFMLGVQYACGVFARADSSHLDAYHGWLVNLAHFVKNADVKQDISSLILIRLHGKRCQTVKENTDCKQTCDKSATEGFYLTIELTACLASAQCQTFSLSCSNGVYRLLTATMILTP